MMMKWMTLLCLWTMPSVVQGFVIPAVAGRSTPSPLCASSTASIDTPQIQTANGEMVVQSHADWMELLMGDLFDDTATSSIKVVFFHASWCKFCQRFRLQWNRQRRLYGSKATFASVEYSANRKLCQSLDIEHFPTVQFYYQDSLLHSGPCSPKSISTVKQRLELYLDMDEDELEQEADLWEQGVDSSQANILLP